MAHSKLNPATFEKEAQVLKLRRLGLTFDAIAKQLGYANASGSYKAFGNALKRIIYDEVEQTRKMEMDRLDMAQQAIMTKVSQGDVPAVHALIRLMERRARLLGLDMPTKAQIEVTHYDSDTIDAEVIRLAALLDGGAQKALDARPSESRTNTN